MNEITIRVRCRQTRDLFELPLRDARLAGSEREPWVAYDCPLCSTLEGVAVAGAVADELKRHGMTSADHALAVELLEPHPAGEFNENIVEEYLFELGHRDDLVGLLIEETLGNAA